MMTMPCKFTTISRYALVFTLMFASTLTFQIQAQIRATTAQERLNSFKNRTELDSKSRLKNVNFKNIGPSIMGGRVIDIDVNPKNPNEFYIAYATGGLWHTTNNGLTLQPIFDKENAIGIGDIAVNWMHRDIWVGTGE